VLAASRPLDGKVAVVTGAGSGIGRATASALAALGAACVVADIEADAGRQAVACIEQTGGRAAFVRTDVARPFDVERMIDVAQKSFGPVDIVVNNAGVVEALDTQLVAFPEIDADRWMRMLDVNLRGVILGTQFAIAAMRGRGGSIVNIASGAGIGYTAHSAPVYAASKAGVARFTAALAPLAKSAGVRVNCICPGWTDTRMVHRGRAEHSAAEWAKIAPKVMLRPEDIAAAVVKFVRDNRLAGRVVLCYEGERPRMLPVR
jgi:NAD(P)-dependent dehydrogenase (short-subunit alcohol dehydrogenase family)